MAQSFEALKKNINKCLVYDRTYAARDAVMLPESRALRDQGYVVIENYMPPDLCDRIRIEVDRLLAPLEVVANERLCLPNGLEIDRRHSFDGRDYYDTDIYNVGYVDKVMDLGGYEKDEKLQRIVDEAAGRPLKLNDICAYVNRGVLNPRGFHFDSMRRAQYKSFVYLTDAETEDFGPYSFVAGSHRPNACRYVNLVWNYLRGYPATDIRLFPKKNIACFTAKKGTLVISDQRGFHRGVPQKPGYERVLLVNNYVQAE